MDKRTLSDLHGELAKARQEVFKAGYDTGFAAAVEVFRSFDDDAEPPELLLLAESLGQPVQQQPAAAAASATKMSKTRFPAGAVAKLIKAFVYSADHPVTVAEFIKQYPGVSLSSRHATVAKLHDEGVIVREGNTWRRPVQVGRVGADNSTSLEETTLQQATG